MKNTLKIKLNQAEISSPSPRFKWQKLIFILIALLRILKNHHFYDKRIFT